MSLLATSEREFQPRSEPVSPHYLFAISSHHVCTSACGVRSPSRSPPSMHVSATRIIGTAGRDILCMCGLQSLTCARRCPHSARDCSHTFGGSAFHASSICRA